MIEKFSGNDNVKKSEITPEVIKPEPAESVKEKVQQEEEGPKDSAKSKERDESELAKVRSKLGLPEKKVVGKEKKKRFETIPVTEAEVIDVLNSGEFYDEKVSRVWNRYCVQCYQEAKVEAENPSLVDDLYDKKRFDTLSKTKFANPEIKDFKGYVSVIKASINKKSAIDFVKEAQERSDPNDNTSEYLDGPKKSKESLLGSGPEVEKIEGLIKDFGAKHDLDELSAILSVEDVSSANGRDSAKLDLVAIHETLRYLLDNTNITTEKYNELDGKFNVLSKAVGIINRGRVEHR